MNTIHTIRELQLSIDELLQQEDETHQRDEVYHYLWQLADLVTSATTSSELVELWYMITLLRRDGAV